MNPVIPRPDGRLSACMKWVRPGAALADVGTDHAILPAFLMADGIVSSAVASDIGEGPCENARKTLEAAGLADKVSVVMTPGLTGLDRYSPTDIVIAGMGGETIIHIISAAEWIRKPDIRLILQPMTKQDELRLYLASEGFSVTAQDLCTAEAPRSGGKNNDKIYEIIVCEYSGREREITGAEALLGLEGCAAPAVLIRRHIDSRLRQIDRRIGGMSSAASPESGVLSELRQIRDEIAAIRRDFDVPDEG